jgi:hypothetical protein
VSNSVNDTVCELKFLERKERRRTNHALKLPNTIFSTLIFTPADQRIVQKVNSCLNLHRLNRIMKVREWNRFIEIVESGQFTFSGDATGFHIDEADGVLDCASPETTLLPDVFPPHVQEYLHTQVGVYKPLPKKRK